MLPDLVCIPIQRIRFDYIIMIDKRDVVALRHSNTNIGIFSNTLVFRLDHSNTIIVISSQHILHRRRTCSTNINHNKFKMRIGLIQHRRQQFLKILFRSIECHTNQTQQRLLFPSSAYLLLSTCISRVQSMLPEEKIIARIQRSMAQLRHRTVKQTLKLGSQHAIRCGITLFSACTVTQNMRGFISIANA